MSSMMKNKQSAALARQRQALAHWLFEWQLEQATSPPAACAEAAAASARDSVGDDVARAPVSEQPTRRRCTRTFQPGDICLLRPLLACARTRPIYLLLLTRCDDGAWLAAPFSRFPVPAVPGEWRTGLRALPVAVLCGWHVRRVDAALLADVWHAMTFPPPRLATARRLAAACLDSSDLDAVAAGGPLPWNEMGPPLRHPDDPRRAYLAEESDRLDELGDRLPLRGTFAHTGQPVEAGKPLEYPQLSRQERLLAAEKREDTYGEK